MSKEFPPEKCARCGEDGSDRRTLYMSCLYDMSELEIPLTLQDDGCYTMRVCKGCRGDWLMAIKKWFDTMPSHALESVAPDRNIPVRVNGGIRMMTEEEFLEYQNETEKRG